jgi:hypothetical protein
MVSIHRALTAFAFITSLGLLAGPVSAQDAVSKAEQVDGNLRPLEAKAIAEEGFIYGLPLVMSYAIMYEASIDRTSGQFKAPINQIKNEAGVFTYKDTAVPVFGASTARCLETPSETLKDRTRTTPELRRILPEGRAQHTLFWRERLTVIQTARTRPTGLV